MKHLACIIFVLAFSALAGPPAQASGDHAALQKAAKDAPAAAMAEAEVRKIDKDGGKVTLKHGEIKSLEMPPMTMVFRVKDKTILDTMKVGDKIRFQAEKIDGQYTVTKAEAAK